MTTFEHPQQEIAHRVEAFEVAACKDANTRFDSFLPEMEHAHFQVVLTELIRVDMEWAWRKQLPRSLAYYLKEYSDLLREPSLIQDLAFEEYRQRRLAGDPVQPQEYSHRYELETSRWPLIQPGSGYIAFNSQVRPLIDNANG